MLRLAYLVQGSTPTAERAFIEMAPRIYAFTSFNGQDYALVDQSRENETRQALEERAKEILFAVASGMMTADGKIILYILEDHLRVVTHATAAQEPYCAALDTPLSGDWVQAQADAARRLDS